MAMMLRQPSGETLVPNARHRVGERVYARLMGNWFSAYVKDISSSDLSDRAAKFQVTSLATFIGKFIKDFSPRTQPTDGRSNSSTTIRA